MQRILNVPKGVNVFQFNLGAKRFLPYGPEGNIWLTP